MFNPLAQVIIQDNSGKELFTFGLGSDIPILDLAWSLEANENGSNCEIKIPLFKDVLDKLLQIKPYIPETKQPDKNTSLPSDGKEATNKEEHIRLIVDEARRQGVNNPKQIAYILATADHESNFVNFLELASGDAYEGDVANLGNTQPGDGRRFRGRGYVQLTGRANYQKYSGILGKDLISNPDLVKQHPARTFILVHGMRTGSFTGVSLDTYTSSNGSVDYYNARAIVNGDKSINGQSIANKAKQYESHPYLVSGSTYANSTDKSVTEVKSTPTANQPSHKILIRAGELGVLFVEFIYLVSEISVGVGSENTISISGVTPLWAINQYKQTYTLSGLSLKQLAERVAKKANLSLEFSGKGTEIVHLENNGLTDYQLLLRECRKAGYVISNNGTKLIVKPIRQGKQYILDLNEIINFTSSIVPGSAIPQTSGGIRGSWEMKPTKNSDPKSGTITSQSTSANQPNKPKTEQDSKTTGQVTLQNGNTVTESQAQTEMARVQDNPTQIDFIPSSSDLLLSPTDMVKINGLEQFSDRLNEIDYYVAGVSYQFNSSGLIGSLKLYKPGIEVKASQNLSGNSNQTATTIIPDNGEEWGLPCPTPYVFRCSNSFRMRNGRFHSGLDITGLNSDNVHATKSGVVKYVETGCVEGNLTCGGNYGNQVEIQHANGYTSLYAHLRRVDVREGQQVTKGQLIGLAGNTGYSFGLHLHFEIRKNSRSIDPQPLIKAQCT